MIEKVKETVRKHALINRGDRIIIGLSGGADSVCLTHVLHSLRGELGIEIMTAHLNHNIRGKDADADARFAAEFSSSLGIDCEIGSADIPEMAKRDGISEETAGRNARYKFFGQLSEKYGFNKIATAHNLNDSAETILMNFMRGSSLSGLSGIPYSRDNIIRPLLDISRPEIEEYCKIHSLSYVTDKTNLENKYTRNRARNILIPLIEEKFNPDFKSALTRNAELIRADEDYIKSAAEKKYAELVSGNSIEADALLECHIAIARRIIRRMIGDVIGTADVSAEFIEKTLTLAKKNKTGSYINLPKNALARMEYGRLVLESVFDTPDYEYKLPLNTDLYIPEADITIRAELADERRNDGAQYFSGIAADSLTIRNRRAGDFFFPTGMNGKKKLKDYFIDRKIPRPDRAKIPLIVSGNDIMHIVGHRRDRRFDFNGKGIKISVSKP